VKLKTPPLSRRQLLNFMGIAAGAYAARDPVMLLMQSMVDGMLSRAIADEISMDTKPRNYVFLGFPGAPSRWQFDNILRPTANSPFVANRTVATAINSTPTAINYAYQTPIVKIAGRDWAMPPLWSTNVGTASGQAPLSTLMNNMLIMRGCDLRQDGHPSNYIRQVLANGGGSSLGGLVADRSSTPIPALSYMPIGYASVYASAHGTPNVNLTSGTPLIDLLTPFTGFENYGFRSKAEIKSAVDKALDKLSDISLTNQPGAQGLFASRRSAEALLRKGVTGLKDVWASLLAKYTSIILQNLRDVTVGGLMPNPIYTFNEAGTDFRWENDTAGNTPAILPAGIDARTILTSSNITSLAESMALTEYVLTQGLSSTVTGMGFHLHSALNGAYFSYQHDQHQAGVAITTLFGTAYFRAVGACLLELTNTLKATRHNSGGTLFDETVIHVAGDFNRSPRIDGSGSDHGFNGSSAMVLSGALSGMQLTGNMYADAGPVFYPSYGGTWGFAAGMGYLGGRTMTIGNIASTICDLLRVPSPTPNDSSLFPTQGSYTAVDEAKNV
jgi:hypothetical protein